MLSKPYITPLLERSIPETEFKVDIVTECLTTTCSECKGEYVNLVFSHKFLCTCKCHKNRRAKLESKALDTDQDSEVIQQ